MPQTSQAILLQAYTPALLADAVSKAAHALRSGLLVALPTETVYGLAANALDPEAIRKIFDAKQRPVHNPVIVHVASLAMAKACVSHWPTTADQLAAAFWPGPLTLVLPRSPCIPDIITAGGDTVGIRWPSHPIMQAVIQACGFPLAAPSANLANHISPTRPQHVLASLGHRIPFVLDGGPCHVGIESTVVDLTVNPPQVLRPGMIHLESLKAVLETIQAPLPSAGKIMRSPGLLDRHYAPKARMVLRQWHDDEQLLRDLRQGSAALDRTCVIAHAQIPSIAGLLRIAVIPHEPDAFARAIYAELHACDEVGAELIVVESPPQSPEWFAITDRLERGSRHP